MTLDPLREIDAPLIDAAKLIDAALDLYATGLVRGASTGWKCIDPLYTVQPGQWTAITGTPGSGKSEWLDAMIVNLVATGEWEFAIYSPENYPQSTHLVKLVEKMVGKPFNPGPTERMGIREFRLNAVLLCQSVYWLEPDLKTPDELIETGLHYRAKGKKLGIVLDPWNTLDHERGGLSDTDYVSYILTKVTKLARAANAHIWLVVHPTKIQKNRDGTRPVPSPYDISGSAHWYNKADNIVTVHRDQSVDSQDVEIHVQKVRFKHCGRVGLATLKYDRITGRYFEFDGPPIIDRFTSAPEKYAPPPMAVAPVSSGDPELDAEREAMRDA